MIRSPFQRYVHMLLQQMTSVELANYRALRRQGYDWAEAMIFGVSLPDISTSLAAFQADRPHRLYQ
jgi:hypothetical protein